MADELDEILEPAADPAAAAEPEKVEVTKDELSRLLRAAEDVDTLRGQLSGLTSQIESFRAQPQPQPQQSQEDAGLTSETLFQDPGKAIDGRINKAVMPAARKFAEGIAGITIDNFKTRKSDDPLYKGVAPIFDEKLKGIDAAYLGSLPKAQLDAALKEAWNASVGEHVQEERVKRAERRPTNLGAAGGGAAVVTKRTLAEVDPATYRLAVQGGLSEEQMQEMADWALAEEAGNK